VLTYAESPTRYPLDSVDGGGDIQSFCLCLCALQVWISLQLVRSVYAADWVLLELLDLLDTVDALFLLLVNCQKRGVAYPRLPYLRRDETMLFAVRVQLVIRSEVTTNG